MDQQSISFLSGAAIAAFFSILLPLAFRKWRSERSQAAHQCEEFTQWVACDNQATVMCHNGKPLPESERYEVSYHFQERRCTLCGKVFQEALAYSSHFDEDGEQEGSLD